MTALAVMAMLLIGSGLTVSRVAFAAGDNSHAYKYFYERLEQDSMEAKFYNAFESLLNGGEFEKGTIKYDLVANKIASKEDVEAYVNGTSDKIAKAFGMGRDAFYMDHPDLFYADVFATSISAGQKGSDYVAYLDSSRAVNTYVGSLDSQEKVKTAINAYENKLAAIVAEANKKATVVEKIEFANNYLRDNNHYGWGTKTEGDRNVDTEKAAFIYTSYGSLINAESVCEGYAKGFKAILDRLGIPCVLVAGYVDSVTQGGYQPHMWNYVRVDGQWYMVDPTFNPNFENKWLLVGGEAINEKYIEDNVVSSSGNKLRYPVLKPYDYGDDTDKNGMSVIGVYDDKSVGKTLEFTISYQGKGARKLREENKYLAFRSGNRNDDGTIGWSRWTDCIGFNEVMGNEVFAVTDYETSFTADPGYEYYQFALIGIAPDDNPYGEGSAKCNYKDEAEAERNFVVAPCVPYRHDGYTPVENSAPWAVSFYPANTGDLPVDRTYDLRVAYHTALKKVDESKDVGLEFTVSAGAESIEGNAFVSDVEWDGNKTITFKFKPSKMYVHNMASYFFTPTNLVGANSNKVPEPFKYSFKGKSVVCSKVFNDGRLYMNVFGQPKMLDDSDLSVTDFKDENNKYYAESQRSQLMLVASKPTSAEEQEMDKVLKQETGIKDNEIIASSTYEIDLQICGLVRKIPNGSYMQVSFGFPEGYSPDDEGTTFKIYHYKHDDNGAIIGVEEIPVIVTQYGLIAKVTSFSPFTIVQVKKDAVQGGEVSVYACVNGGKGGTVTADGKSGIAEITGDTITYDITADQGFAVGAVRLNGKVVDSAYYKDGKLTLAKKNIESSNILEVTFVSAQMQENYAKDGITISYGALSDVDFSDFGKPPASNVAGIVIGVIAAVLVLAGGGFAIWWFFIKKKQQPVTATAGRANASAVKRPTQTKPAQSRPAQSRPTQSGSTQTKPAQSRPAQTRPAQSAQSRQTQARPTQTGSTKTSQTRTAQSAQAKPSQTVSRPAQTHTRPVSGGGTNRPTSSARPAPKTTDKTRPSNPKK